MIQLQKFTRGLAIFALGLASVTAVQAQIYNENGDAGTTLGTAQATGVTGSPLTTISGSILNAFDGDFFYITITNPAIFTATTLGGSGLDTMLYLFSLDGNPIYLNDDDPNGLSLQSTLPTNASLAIGTYIIGISLSGAEPINAANQNLFADGVFSTDVRGPRAGVLGPVIGVRQGTFAESGAYSIFLTGASASAIPEPGTVALFTGAGFALFLGLRRRLRRS